MKSILKVLLALVVILVGAALIVPFLIPMDVYKNEAIERLSKMTGREISIAGDVHFQVVPDVAIVLNQVAVGNPPGFTSPYLAKIDKLNIGVALSPLFNKELVIQKFELNKPDIYLETNQAGKANWDIEFNAPETSGQAAALAVSNTRAQENDVPQERSGFKLSQMQLSKLSITAGKLVHIGDEGRQMLTDISLASDEVNISQPTKIDGSAVWNGEKLKIIAKVDSIEALMDRQTTKAVVSISSDPIKLNFNGKLSTTSMRGALDAGSASLVKTLSWLGKPTDWKATPLLFAVKGMANCNLSRCQISDANFALDGNRLQGDLTADYNGKTSISANLTGQTLDLRKYIGKQTAQLDSLSLISNAYAAANWSSERIDLSALNALDMDLTLAADQIITPDVTLRQTKLQSQLRNGSLSVNILRSEIFGGVMDGLITALPRDNYINTAARLNLKQIQIGDFLKTFTGDAKISGRTDLNTSLTARGSSISGLIHTLSGSGNFTVSDGAIKGVNIAQMARNIQSAFRAEASTEQTDFAELKGSYTISNGVISNQDLSMKAPFLRMTASGTINLPAYTINYRLLPELVETSKGQGGKDKTGIIVPILVTGSLDNPRFTPDVQAMLENPEMIKDNISAVKGRIDEEKINFKENKEAIKQQLKDLKTGLKEDPALLLKDPDRINTDLNNLLGGFGSDKPAAPVDPVTPPANEPAVAVEPAPAEAVAPTPDPAPASASESPAATPASNEPVPDEVAPEPTPEPASPATN